MTTTTDTKPMRKRRAPKSAPQIHPAILAMRAEHVAFSALHHTPEDMHVCYFSDLGHDERAITEHAPNAFGWILTRHSTHMLQITKIPGEARAELSAKSRARRGPAWASAVVDAYRGHRCAFFLWDGTTLIRCSSAEDLTRRIDACTARVALADAERRLTEAREDRAAAGEPGGVWFERCAGRVTEIEQEIRTLTEEYL